MLIDQSLPDHGAPPLGRVGLDPGFARHVDVVLGVMGDQEPSPRHHIPHIPCLLLIPEVVIERSTIREPLLRRHRDRDAERLVFPPAEPGGFNVDRNPWEQGQVQELADFAHYFFLSTYPSTLRTQPLCSRTPH